MRKIVSIQIVYLLCFVATLQGQPKTFFWGNDIIKLIPEKNKYQSIVYGTKNGLISSEITCLAQGRKGYLWIGTSSGLSRYDGLKFENFFKGDNHFTGKIYTIKEDSIRDIMWIACDAGLCYFQNEQLHFVNFKERDIAVYDIYFLKDNSMWIGTGNGPVFFTRKATDSLSSQKTISLSSFLLPQWKTFNSQGSLVDKILTNESGDIYFAGGGNIFFYNKNNFEKIWSSKLQQNNNDNIIRMVPGNGDTIFFASVFSGLYSIQKKETKRYAESKTVSADLIEHNGQFYYFTMDGIFQFFSPTKPLKKLSEVPAQLNVWPSCLLVDNENNFWIGFHDNLIYQKPRSFVTYVNEQSGVEPELYSVLQLKNNELLFGANRGKVYKLNGAVFKNIFGNGQIVPRAEIKSMYEDSRGWLWLGTGYEGISVIKNNETLHFTKTDGLASNSNYFFYEDDKGNIYTGGDGGFSRINFDSSANQFGFKSFYYRVAGDNFETFKNCVAGPNGSLWLAGEKGLFHFKNDILSHYSLNDELNLSISDIKKDKTGNIWLAIKGDGIWECFFDANNVLQLKKIFSQKDGLLSNIYLDLTIDHENNVWAGGYSCITSIKSNHDRFGVTNYTSSDGFLSSNYQALRIYCGNNDTIWVATSSGLTSFDARNIGVNRKLLLNFTNISLVDTSKKIASYKKNEEESVVELPHFLNGIEFHFAAVCLSDPQKIMYSFRLIGLDSSWIDWDNKGVAVYQNLSPGAYSFEVKASLDNNNTTTPITFSFLIKKPFWLSWWFIISGVLIMILIVYFLQKRLKKNIRLKHEEKIKNQKLISENLQYQLEIEQVTNYFTTSMSTCETVDDLLWDVAMQCISKLNFEDCVIYTKEDETGMLIQKAAWGPKSNTDGIENGKHGKIISPIEIPLGKGIVGSVASSGIAEIIPDVTKDTRYIKDDKQRLSEIAVPVIYDNNVLGVIDSESDKLNFYSERHLKILTTIASHCAERIVKLRTDENLHRNQLELLQVNNRLTEEKLTALRSQMNPHFIFNCLNSIQQFILTGEVDNANKYLSRFSKLIRLVLQYSESNFISLEEEIDMLELYLSLEKTRFGNTFEYNIFVDNDLDTDEIKIPNLMIQPFVENAIWHGLMHKEDDRKIDISFRLKNDDSIVCEVADNGIGRKRAAEIKERRSLEIKHQSKGMQLIKDKIDILKQQFKSDILIELSDVLSSAGDVCGTKVTIQLPLQY